MSFFDSIFGSSFTKHSRRIGSRDAQTEDREASAKWLLDEGSKAAVTAVFNRFELQLDHTLKDKTEKQKVFDLLVAHGKASVQPAKDFAARSVHFQWAVQVVDAIDGSEAGTQVLVELLSREKLENEFKPEKKRNLLLALAERKSPSILAAAAPFLADFDEGVRHAAIEAIAGQECKPEDLSEALYNLKEESTRIRGRLAEIFALRGWTVELPAGWTPPPGFRVVDGKLMQGNRGR